MRLVVSSLLVVALGALGVASACLPDLVIVSAADGGPAPACGDGFIDPDAGEECDPGSGEGGAATACPECKVACVVGSDPHTIDPATHHCYFWPGAPIAREADAKTACEGAGGHVARFVSQDELGFVMNWAPNQTFWVGLSETSGAWFPNEDTPEPGWAQGCLGCFAGGPDGGSIVKVAPADTKLCVIATAPPGSWFTSACAGVSHYTVCEREPVGTRARACSAGICLTAVATQATKRYVVVLAQLYANDAVQVCAGQGGRLAVFGSPEEREQVAYEIAAQRGLPQEGFWIGLSTATGAWAWDVPDAGMTPLPWGIGQPSGDAGRAYILVEQGAQGFPDSELARVGNVTDAGGETHLALCEVP